MTGAAKDVGKVGVLPRVGYGTWRLTGERAVRGVRMALDAGYRHIDTAEAYGNEAEVGRAIAESGLKREEIFLVTKVKPEHLGPGQVGRHARASLDRLRVDAVDLLLVHWPSIGDAFAMADYVEQFAALQDEGLARHIGVANFTRRHMDEAGKILGKRAIACNQIEIHVFLQNRRVVEHCRALGVPTTAYCPVAHGEVADNATLKAIAARRGATAAQVALAFLLAEGHAVIPMSSNPARIAENIAAADLALSAQDIAEIRKLDSGRRLVDGGWAPKWDT